MIKFKQGSVYTKDGSRHADIVVRSAMPNTLSDMLIGGGIVLAGILYLTATAFRNGSKKYELAELEALNSVDLLLG